MNKKSITKNYALQTVQSSKLPSSFGRPCKAGVKTPTSFRRALKKRKGERPAKSFINTIYNAIKRDSVRIKEQGLYPLVRRGGKMSFLYKGLSKGSKKHIHKGFLRQNKRIPLSVWRAFKISKAFTLKKRPSLKAPRLSDEEFPVLINRDKKGDKQRISIKRLLNRKSKSKSLKKSIKRVYKRRSLLKRVYRLRRIRREVREIPYETTVPG
jgi:hypothetical protein